MNQYSLSSFNKISMEIDRLSKLVNKEELYDQEVQLALQRGGNQTDSQSSALQNIDLYIRQYDNPTTKSLPLDEQAISSSQILEGDSETINTIYRNRPILQSQEGDRQICHDDKSTIILAGLKNPDKKEKELKTIPQKTSLTNYSSLNNEAKINKKQLNYSKTKKPSPKNATSSIPSDIYISNDNYKSENNFLKNNSVSKHTNRIQSPLVSQPKKKKQIEGDSECLNFIKELKGKLTKVNKLDHEELNRLQQKKNYKKTDLSSNRKKTNRELGNAKITTNMTHYSKLVNASTSNLKTKTNGNSSLKYISDKKKETPKKIDKLIPNLQDWQRMQKTSKKLNRVNIYKLQENLKKANDKKIREIGANRLQKKERKLFQVEPTQKQENHLKLNFTEGDEESNMKKLIQEKQLNKEYDRQTNRYVETAKKMSTKYFQTLMKECRETSEQAILKIKLVTLLLYFFDQFSKTSLITQNKTNTKLDQFFINLAQQQIIETLLHPKKIIKIIMQFPTILMIDNIISAQRIHIFGQKFTQINQQLDQELQFFLIKKSTLYMFIHTLSEYINFLLQKQLIAQTKRVKLVSGQAEQVIHGYYSSRSKKDEGKCSKKYIKKNQRNNRICYRCDSDRKITIEDEDFCYKELEKMEYKDSGTKGSQLKKVFK